MAMSDLPASAQGVIDEIVDQVMEHNFAVGDVLIPPSKIREMMVKVAELASEKALAHQVQVLSLKPGDILVVHLMEDPVGHAHAESIQAAWTNVAKRFDAKVIACSGVDKFSVLRAGKEGQND